MATSAETNAAVVEYTGRTLEQLTGRTSDQLAGLNADQITALLSDHMRATGAMIVNDRKIAARSMSPEGR